VASIWDVSTARLDEALQAALMRLQIYVLGQVHAIFFEVATVGRAVAIEAATEYGTLDGLGLNRVQQALEGAWRTAMTSYEQVLAGGRRQAVEMAFGLLAVMHERYVGQGMARLEEQVGMGAVPFFEEQLEALLQAANERLYGDGLRLSQRVWRLDQEGLAGIQETVYAAVARGDSAINLARELEAFLGAGAECPRWTRTRLYGLTKQEIADGNRSGLYSGDECAGQGVAYKALRLARTEIQYIHHAADDLVRAQMPWVEGERVRLSPSHPEIGCVCEDVVAGGEEGNGTYPKGEIVLPLHPHCLCWKEALLMDEDEFVERLRRWTNGDPWTGMDDYATWTGMSPATGKSPFLQGLEEGLQLWLWGSRDDLDAAIAEAA
jgi:hypothetical protein